MNFFYIVLFSFLSLSTFAKTVTGTIAGTVTVGKGVDSELKGGTLFIFAKSSGSKSGDGQMPIAVQRISNPSFPAKFELSAENTMIKGTPFEGPFSIYARYSPTGDATDKSGPEGATPEKAKIKVGDSGVKIELKKRK